MHKELATRLILRQKHAADASRIFPSTVKDANSGRGMKAAELDSGRQVLFRETMPSHSQDAGSVDYAALRRCSAFSDSLAFAASPGLNPLVALFLQVQIANFWFESRNHEAIASSHILCNISSYGSCSEFQALICPGGASKVTKLPPQFPETLL